MIGMIAGDQLGPSLVDSIARRSDGNAFFAEELVAATESSRSNHDGLPDTLRGLLHGPAGRRRTEDAGHLVEIAAVAGREVEHDVLAEVCGLSETDLSRALHEALDAQLLFVAGPARACRTLCLPSCARAGSRLRPAPAVRAARAPWRLRRAIEARPAGAGAAQANRLVELAHHWAAAQESSLALHAALGAGDASQTVYAYAEAAREYERATELWDVVPAPDRPADRDLADIFDSAASAAIVDRRRRASGQPRAQGASSWSMPRPTRPPTRERRARAREQLGFASWLAGDTATSIQRLEEAMDLLEGTPPSTEQARVLAGLAANLMLAGQARQSIPFAERAIETRARGRGRRHRVARHEHPRRRPGEPRQHRGRDRAPAGGPSRSPSRSTIRPSCRARTPTSAASSRWVASWRRPSRCRLAGAERTLRYGSELSFRSFLRVNAAAMLIELARYPEADGAARAAAAHVLPGVSTIHSRHLGAPRRADRRPGRRPTRTSRSRRDEASGIDDAQFVIDLCTWSGPRSRCGAGIRPRPSRSPATGSTGWSTMDDAIILGQLAIPAAHAAADLAVRARAARDEPAAKDAAAAARDRDRSAIAASTERLSEPDELATQRDRLADGSVRAELRRAAGEDDPATLAGRPPGAGCAPAPFLEAYVLWRAAEAMRRPGRDGRGRRATARGPRDRDQDRRRAARRPGSHGGPGACASTCRGVATDGRAWPPTAGGSVEPADPFGLTSREREVLAPRRRGLHEPAHRRDAVHQREHGRRPRLAHPRQARRRDPHRGGRGRGQARARSGRCVAVAASALTRADRLRSAALTRSSSVDSTPTSASAARDASRASASE